MSWKAELNFTNTIKINPPHIMKLKVVLPMLLFILFSTNQNSTDVLLLDSFQFVNFGIVTVSWKGDLDFTNPIKINPLPMFPSIFR